MLYIFYYDDESQLFYVMIDGTAVELFTTVRARTKSAGPVTIIYKNNFIGPIRSSSYLTISDDVT